MAENLLKKAVGRSVQEQQKRSSYWDNIKGLLILLTVFAHILFQLQDSFSEINETVDIIYMFHMPAFVFVSGFFGKSKRSQSFSGIMELVFLYFIFNSTMGFIYGFESLLKPMYSYWYFIALIAWRVTAHHIAKFREINLILLIIALFVGFYPTVDNTLASARILGFYPFYMSGYLLSSEKSNELEKKEYAKRAVIGILSAGASLSLSLFAYQFFNYSDNALQMAGYADPIDAFGRIVLYIIAFTAVYALRHLSPDRKVPLLTMFGRNSLWIFVFHRPITFIISDAVRKLQLPAVLLWSALLSAVICLVFGNDLVSKYMNRFMKNGAEIITRTDKGKVNFSKISAIIVSLFFIVSVVINSYI